MPTNRREYSFATQEVGLPSIVNARELGGYILPDGRKVRGGLLLRGGALAGASDEDIALFRDRYHLVHNFDFRTKMELETAPDRVIEGADHIWLPAIDELTEALAGRSLPDEAYRNLPDWLVENSHNEMVQDVAHHLYLDMVFNEYTQLQYAAFLQTLVSTKEGAVYWHCSQGKDRTGLASTFLLAALGADRELIMQDYLISYEFYKDLVESLYKKVSTEAERKVILTFIGVNAEYYEEMLDLIDKRYGSLMAYLKGPLCLTDGDMEVLRSRYLE